MPARIKLYPESQQTRCDVPPFLVALSFSALLGASLLEYQGWADSKTASTPFVVTALCVVKQQVQAELARWHTMIGLCAIMLTCPVYSCMQGSIQFLVTFSTYLQPFLTALLSALAAILCLSETWLQCALMESFALPCAVACKLFQVMSRQVTQPFHCDWV